MSLFKEKTSIREWLPVMTLAFSAFIFITTEIMPIGLLPDISKSLGKTESFTGLIVTVYAWSVALCSLPLVMLTKFVDRKKLLIGVFTIFALCHILAAQAKTFEMLLLARIGTSFVHAIFWSIAIPLAARLSPEGKKAKALAIIVTGGSLATVMGMPIGTLIGHHFGWRTSFAGIAGLALIILLIILKTLPFIPGGNESNIKSLGLLLKKKSIVIVYVLTLFFVTGHFTTFSYLVPFLQQVAHIDRDLVVFLLLLLGVAGIFGSGLASRHVETKPFLIIGGGLCLIAFCLVFLKAVAEYRYILGLFCLVWGAGMVGVGLVLQVFILRLAEKSADMGIAIYSSIFNVGIGGGALIGSLVLYYLDSSYIGYFGSVFVILALGALGLLWKEERKNTSSLE